jgi:type I restriction enzyme S subunit
MAMRDGWTETTLDELVVTGVISLGRGNVISKRDMEADPGPYPVYSSAQNNDGRIGSYNKFMFDEELITWSVDGGGYVFHRPHHKFSVTNIGGYLRILDNTKFLYPFLAAVLQKLHGQHVFDWQNKAHPSVIRKLYNNIPLASLDEQRRIMDVVSSVDAYIDSLQQQADSARTARNAVLHELLSAGGDDWTETTLGEVATWGSGGTPKSGESSYYDGDIPWCVIGDLTESEVFLTEKCITEEGLRNSSAKIVEPGAVMIAMYGASIGRTGIVGRPMATNQAIAFAYPDGDNLDNRFLLHFLQTQKQKFVEAGQGAAQPNISQTVLKSWPILLPSMEEQKRIVDVVSAMDDVIQATENAIGDAKNLRSGLLSDLLSGEHEIPASYDKLMGAA